MPDTRHALSVCTDDLRLEIKRALQVASRLGFRAVDIGAADGPLEPRHMSRSAQRHLTRYLGDLGLRLGSLRGPVTGPSYGDGAIGERKLESMRSIIALAGELRVPVVSTSLGHIDADASNAVSSRLLEAVETIANDSDRHGVNVAIETAGIAPDVLRDLLARVNCPNLGACCDSGAMLMEGHDPHRIADALPGRVHVVRARDATAGTATASGRETAMGEGALDIPVFVASLFEAGFKGDMIVSRSDSMRPEQDLAAAGRVLKTFLMPT